MNGDLFTRRVYARSGGFRGEPRTARRSCASDVALSGFLVPFHTYQTLLLFTQQIPVQYWKKPTRKQRIRLTVVSSLIFGSISAWNGWKWTEMRGRLEQCVRGFAIVGIPRVPPAQAAFRDRVRSTLYILNQPSQFNATAAVAFTLNTVWLQFIGRKNVKSGFVRTKQRPLHYNVPTFHKFHVQIFHWLVFTILLWFIFNRFLR